jgi:Phage tail tube protein
MTNIPPGVAPSSRSWLGIAREIGGGGVSGVGTPTLPTNTIPLDKSSYEIEDMIKYLEDLSIRGSMSQRFADVLGVDDGNFSFGGPVFGDVFPFFFDNIFGDLSTTGSSPANGTHITNSGGVVVGGTAITVPTTAGYTNSSIVQIDSGSVSEVVILNAVAGTVASSLVFSNYPLRFAHGSAATVTTVTGPYTHTFAVLNSTAGYGGAAGAQPPTHSLTDNTYLTPGVYARTYPGACVGQVELSGNSENLFMGKASGNTWLSAPASTIPTNSTTFTVPLPNWRSTLTIGTTATYDVTEWTMTIKRELQVYWTQQNSQTPFIIARGTLDATGGMKFDVPSDETPLNYYLQDTQPEVQIVITNGQVSTSEIQYTITAHEAAFTKSKPVRSGVLVGYDNEYQTVANTSDVGGSGGLGQITIAVLNNTPTY